MTTKAQAAANLAARPELQAGSGSVAEVYGNRYEVQERVGDGGMATVYRGTDRQLQRDVAIKVMHPHLAARSDARQRFSREAIAAARVKHPNIVEVYDTSKADDEQSFIITEFVHGETLTAFCSGHGPFLPQAAALIGHVIAAALSAAHSRGIVHRDIKPDNLMVSFDGQIKLMDFGIAQALDMQGMTATGAIVGSPAHMAPEQIEGEELDARCDLFALGIVLYFLVTRRLPFQASNPHALFRQILEGNHELASHENPAVDRQFEAIIEQCMARQRADRYATAEDLQIALGGYLKQFRMSDVATLLPRFLKTPEVFQYDLRKPVVQEWTHEGKRLAAAGQLALAIDAFNRALAVDPTAEEPQRALASLTARSRRRRELAKIAKLAGATAVAISAGVGLWHWIESEPVLPTGPAGAPQMPLPGSAPKLRMPELQVPPVVVARPVQPPEPLPPEPTPTMVASAANAFDSKFAKPEDHAAAEKAKQQGKKLTVDPKTAGKRGNETETGQPVPPPPAEKLAKVQLGCAPFGTVRYGSERSDTGILRTRVPAGRHTFTCEFPQCPDCPPLPVPFRAEMREDSAEEQIFNGSLEQAQAARDRKGGL